MLAFTVELTLNDRYIDLVEEGVDVAGLQQVDNPGFEIVGAIAW